MHGQGTVHEQVSAAALMVRTFMHSNRASNQQMECQAWAAHVQENYIDITSLAPQQHRPVHLQEDYSQSADEVVDASHACAGELH